MTVNSNLAYFSKTASGKYFWMACIETTLVFPWTNSWELISTSIHHLQFEWLSEKSYVFLLAYTESPIAVGLARVDSANQQMVCGGMKELLSHDLDPPLHSLVIPGLLHFIEKDMFRITSLDSNVLDKSWHTEGANKQVYLLSELMNLQLHIIAANDRKLRRIVLTRKKKELKATSAHIVAPL